MRRRDFLALVATGVAVRPIYASAQGPTAPVIGFFSGGSPYEWAPFVAAFRQGLNEMGYREDRDVSIEFRWGFGEREKLQVLAHELAARRVDVLVVSGGFKTMQAALDATSTTPIVEVFGDDPVGRKLVESIAQPGGRVTGVSVVSRDIENKRLQIIREMIPTTKTVGLITDPRIPPDVQLRKDFKAATQQLGLQGIVVAASGEAEIDDAFAMLAQRRVDALEVASTAYFLDRRDRIAALAARYKIPTMYAARAYADAGGLVSYGVDRVETYRQLGRYTGAILHGSVPAEMPVLPPSKFELAVNLNAAKALGVTFPQSLMTLADAIIR